MFTNRRQFIAGVAAAGVVPSACIAAETAEITPEAFGAKGDGRTNDTDAFAAMSAHVNARGGGTIALRRALYIVGKQARNRGGIQPFAYAPLDIIHLVGCSKPVLIHGNGAILRSAPGLRFGTFNPDSGVATSHKLPFRDRRERSAPYQGMVFIERCADLVVVKDLELDGNLKALEIGGKYNKGGWQLPGSGIFLRGNSGAEQLSRIYSHHHPLDGIMIVGSVSRTTASTISELRCEYNVRQGCSITAGRNYNFDRCAFRHTGKAGLRSLPGAGVDIEAERGRPIRNLVFRRCEFSNNAGPGLAGAGGDVEGASFEGCTFVGTTSPAAWPKKPRIRFSNCRFVGSILHVHGDADPARATHFLDCTFSDDPEFSPTGAVFGNSGRPRPIVELANSPNVLFNRCRFRLTGNALLPSSRSGAIYSDCEMTQRSPRRSRPRGTYLGTNILSGNIDLAGSTIRGTVILNGQPVPRNA